MVFLEFFQHYIKLRRFWEQYVSYLQQRGQWSKSKRRLCYAPKSFFYQLHLQRPS